MAHEIDHEYASLRTDEMADEITRHYAQRGQAVAFGLDTGIATQRYMEASQLVYSADRAQPDLLTMTFLMPVQDAKLIRKAGSYPFKGLVGRLICATVRELLDRAGKSEVFNNLSMAMMHGSTAEIREDAHTKLLRMAAPYFREAQGIVMDDVRLYNPSNEFGPNARSMRP